MPKNRKKFRHLTANQRDSIQAGLLLGHSMRRIAKVIGTDPATVSREIKRHGIAKEGWGDRDECLRKKRLPCCNMCPKKTECSGDKLYYDCRKAQEAAHMAATEIRGPEISSEEFRKINDAVGAGVKRGQSIEHICRHDPALRGISAARVRHWIRIGIMDVKPAYLRRFRRLHHKRPHRPRKDGLRPGSAVRFGRTMDDFARFRKSLGEDGFVLVQTDSVVGRTSDSSRLLTLMIPQCGLQVGCLYSKSRAASEVLGKTKEFLRRLMEHTGKDIAVVTDNGSEFACYDRLERISGRIHVFFADPYRSSDKAQCERNHEFFRYVYPKGVSLDGLSQKEIDGCFSNINSYGRKSLQNKSPYDVTVETFGRGFLDALNIRRIEPKDVDLRVKQ